ncbi:MAG: hypothetical protein QXP44_04830 [Candidatus Bathyarchaeia archaeon]
MNRKIVNCPYCGKILSEEVWKGTNSTIPQTVKCPQCSGKRLWKDGKRKIASGEVQRYYCRDCGFRFSRW